MSDDVSTEEKLLREYAQAGEVTRADQRTSQIAFQIFWVFATVLGAFLAKETELTPGASILLCLAGISLGIATVFLLRRLSRYTCIYMRRARTIEKQLGIELYTLGNLKLSEKGPSNKTVLIYLVWAAVLAFLIPLTMSVLKFFSLSNQTGN